MPSLSPENRRGHRLAEKISVALCTYNGAAFIEAQLASILDQDRPPDEVVVSDDGSTDCTPELVKAQHERFEARGVSLRFQLHSTPLGVVRNFESAIQATTGDIVFLSDQDDIWRPSRVSESMNEFTRRPGLSALFADARLVDVDAAPLGSTLFHWLQVTSADRASINARHAFPVLLRRNLATGATMAIRRSLLDDALPFPVDWVHDEWLAIIAASREAIGLLDQPLIDYRQHGGNQIGVRKPTLRHRITTALAPRGLRVNKLVSRSHELSERLASLDGVAVEYLAAVRAKREFETWRLSLPAARLRRITPVLQAMRSGGYALYSSQGNLDVLRDLSQPHG